MRLLTCFIFLQISASSAFAWEMESDPLPNGVRVTSLSEIASSEPDQIEIGFACRSKEKKVEFTIIIGSDGDTGHGYAQGVAKYDSPIILKISGKSPSTYKLRATVIDGGNSSSGYAVRTTDAESDIVRQIVTDLSFSNGSIAFGVSTSGPVVQTTSLAFARFASICFSP